MSWLISTDPLALQAMQAGMVRPPLADQAAQGDTQLDAKQRACEIGEPIPVVFCRRDETAGTGGVLISPGASEARFTNDATNAVTASYLLVLSEGRIGLIQVRDVFQRSCRVGQFTQTYNRRAGTWMPGNYITAILGYTVPQCPHYCGTVGAYQSITTLSFTNAIPNGSDQWDRQVHCFIRNGMEVDRLLDGATGSSNNFADLYNWALLSSARLAADQIDYVALISAARFLQANQFNCDINITASENLSDFAAKLAPYFLLTETRVAGRRGLRPILPTRQDGTINTDPLDWVYVFTEDHILPGQFQINYIPPAERKPFAVRTIWRQQLTDDHGIIRTSEVRYNNEAESGPYEQHDLSRFCTREDHAVKVAAYIRAKRKHVTHTVTLSCRAIDFPPTLKSGDIVRLKVHRASDLAAASLWDYLYEIEQITKSAAGEVSLVLVHCPIDSTGASLVAQAVANAEGTGLLLTSNRTGISCDVHSSSDQSVPAEAWQNGQELDQEISLEEEPAEETPTEVYDETNTPPTEEAPEPDPEAAPSNANPYAPANWVSFNFGNAPNSLVTWTNNNQNLHLYGPCDQSGVFKYLLCTTTAAAAGNFEFSWNWDGTSLVSGVQVETPYFVIMEAGYNGDPNTYPDPLNNVTELSVLDGYNAAVGSAQSGTMTVALTAGQIFGFLVVSSYNLEGDTTAPHLVLSSMSLPT